MTADLLGDELLDSAMPLGEAMRLALEWTHHRVPVFPVAISWNEGKQATDKRPLTLHGFKDASTDEREVRRMFNKASPRDGEVYGVGLHLGPAGVFALDLDDKNGRRDTVTVEALDLPGTFTVFTASGGQHRYFRTPEGRAVTNASPWPEVSELRGDDGFVIAPGTRTPWGEWATNDVFPNDVSDLPDHLAGDLPVKGSRAKSSTANGSTKVLTDDERDKLTPADLDALEQLLAQGWHYPILHTQADRLPWVALTRPGKAGGATSATVGYIDPGVVKVWTDGVEGLAPGVYSWHAEAQRFLTTDEANEWWQDRIHQQATNTNGDGEPDVHDDHEHDVHAGDPGRFFDKREGLLVQTLADEVRHRVRLARIRLHRDGDGDDALWHYDSGVWRPGGAAAAERVVAALLGERLRGAHVANALLALRTRHLVTLDDNAPHPDLINFTNTMVRWATGDRVPHDPAAGSTVQLAVPWEPDATCPMFDRWLLEVLPDDAVPYAWEAIGYLMMNGNPLHKAFMLRGTGRNGKGTFLRIVKALLGAGNCASVPLQVLSENRFAAAELHMKLANIAGDLDARHVEDTSTFKMVTGEDVIQAERKYAHPFRFTPWAVPVFSANSTPGSSDTSAGYMARWEVLPFPVDLTGRIDANIERTIKTNELPGIARAGVEGLRRLMDRGCFDRPASITEAFDRFASDVDQVRAFIAERCDRGTGLFGDRTVIHEAYKRWAIENDKGILSASNLYDRIEVAGYRSAKRKGLRGFVGLGLREGATTW